MLHHPLPLNFNHISMASPADPQAFAAPSLDTQMDESVTTYQKMALAAQLERRNAERAACEEARARAEERAEIAHRALAAVASQWELVRGG